MKSQNVSQILKILCNELSDADLEGLRKIEKDEDFSHFR